MSVELNHEAGTQTSVLLRASILGRLDHGICSSVPVLNSSQCNNSASLLHLTTIQAMILVRQRDAVRIVD